MASTCDGLRLRTKRDMQFMRTGESKGVFVVPTGTVCMIVENATTRAYTDTAKKRGEDLIPVMLEGQVRYVARVDLEKVK